MPDNHETAAASAAGREPHRGRLKIFFSYAPGAGKAYRMLEDAQEQLRAGADVLIGYLEPHTRPETIRLLSGLPLLPLRLLPGRSPAFREFDLDGALIRHPQIILVAGLARRNADGMRNRMRYQDVEELLNAGIDVYTTLNVEHIESLNDVVQGITGTAEPETVPDAVFDRADRVVVVDIEPEDLLSRYRQMARNGGDGGASAPPLLSAESLRLLREVALRKAADRISRLEKSQQYPAPPAGGNRFLVCIGPSPSSARCIRWTARTAGAFHAPWAAVYVETRDRSSLTDGELRGIRNNMELVERMGAECVTLNGEDIASVVAEYARLSGATNIVVGKSRNKKSLRTLFDIDFEDKLIALLPGAEVHMIPDSVIQPFYHRSRRLPRPRDLHLSWKDTLKTLGMLGLATLASFFLWSWESGDRNVVVIYILSVLIISRITSGYFYGIAASVLGVLAANFFFSYPQFTPDFLRTRYPITFVIMLLVALITSALTARIKTQAKLSVEREWRTEVLYEINRSLLVTEGLDNIAKLANNYLSKLFGRSAIFYTREPDPAFPGLFLQAPEEPDASVLLSPEECAVARWAFINQKNAGAGTDTLSGAAAFYMPVRAQGHVVGVLGLSCRRGPLKQENRLFLGMIASQVAMALERQHLSDEQRQILVESEKEKMRSNLLRAISHDLRTPLTGILGASSAILESGDMLDKATHDKLVANIREDSQWLIRMVENLLSVTRISDGAMKVEKRLEMAEEIVAEAVSRIRSRFPGQKISVRVPDEPLMVPMDGTLIEQVVINLLENAAKHSVGGSPIEVEVSTDGRAASFEVTDHGSGIAEQEFPYLFESYVPNGKRSSDSTRGMGIGLSICMSIVKAHHGKMEAANRESGGAVFRFTLPLEGETEYEQ